MNKKTKVLSITLPVTLATATLASTAGILVSCSKNNTGDNSNVNQNPNIDILLNSSNIQNFETNLNSSVANITINQFNSYFVGNHATTNINTFAEKLGISDYVSNIESIVASGEYNNATITISISDGYNFVLIGDQTSTQSGVTSAISEDKKSFVFSGVVFAQYVTITELASNIDLNTQFATVVGSSVQGPDSINGTSDGVTINNDNLNINITIPSNNPYFNVSLPNNVNDVFNIDNLCIENDVIEWKLGEPSTNIKLINENNKQFIYNTQPIINSDINVVATIKNLNGIQTANQVNLIFNFINNIDAVLNPTTLDSIFSFTTYASSDKVYSKNITTSKNEINISVPSSSIYKQNNIKTKPLEPVVPSTTSVVPPKNFMIDIFMSSWSDLNDALFASIFDLAQFNKKTTTIIWEAPVITSYSNNQNNPQPDFSCWQLEYNYSSPTPPPMPRSTSIWTNSNVKMDWKVTIKSNDGSFKPISTTFNVSIDIGDLKML